MRKDAAVPEALADEIKTELETLTPYEFASRRILEPIPHAFAGDLAALSEWKAELGRALEVDPRSMAIVGSAAIGVSLKPGRLLRPFGDGSDVDVAVVSHFHFERAWRRIRNLPPSVRASLGKVQKRSVRSHEMDYIYRGAVATDKILDLLPFAETWVPGLSKMEGIEPSAGRPVRARIYRDFEALRQYQLKSILRAQEELEAHA
jgi:hypothetical protein